MYKHNNMSGGFDGNFNDVQGGFIQGSTLRYGTLPLPV